MRILNSEIILSKKNSSQPSKTDNKQLVKYEEIKAKINGIIARANDKDGINQAKTELSELEVIWDSKIYAWHSLTEKAKTFNLEYNKETKNFETK